MAEQSKAKSATKSDTASEGQATRETGKNPKLLASMGAAAGLLIAFAVVASALLAYTDRITRDRIAQQRAETLRLSLREVLPASEYTNDLLADTMQVQSPLLGRTEPVTAYIAKRGGTPIAALFPVTAPNGYSGDITMLMGVRADGTLSGVRVLTHKETPGLGDKIEVRKSPWIKQFSGLSLRNPPANDWAVTKDGGAFDTFTGATITPRAVVQAVKNGLRFFGEHQAKLLNADAPSTLQSADSSNE